MFKHADQVDDFKLFFSFDHGAGILTGNPNQYAQYFKDYSSRKSYFKFRDPKSGIDKPLVSTFGGENVPDAQWAQFKSTVGDVLIVPGYYEAEPSISIFDSKPSIDGVFNWNSWQPTFAGRVRVSSTDDATYQTATENTQRVFMMGMSPYQFKHLAIDQNWYRRGEDNLEYRISQALELQPDIIQLQSWNDAGEGMNHNLHMNDIPL
jgi:glucan endo-1,3-alpha-glucosidase